MEPTKKTIVQKLRINNGDVFVIAEKYYSILSVINALHLTEREIQLIAFTAVKGNMSYKHIREEFCEKHNTSHPTINNIISKLKKMFIFVKDSGKVKVNPAILLPFAEANISLDIKLYGEA